MKSVASFQPVGIIKTMPATWLDDVPGGVYAWEKNFMFMNRSESHYWCFNLSGKPKYKVLYFYILFQGAIRFRANIIGFSPGGQVNCYDGSVHNGKVWVNVGSPVIKLKDPIPMKGFQGFRYTEEIYK